MTSEDESQTAGNPVGLGSYRNNGLKEDTNMNLGKELNLVMHMLKPKT